jgi:sulfur carrier protein|tara:strand:- start:44 stop:244 length:201 start_codon:yes stop_codon:yes gene_type:complete
MILINDEINTKIKTPISITDLVNILGLQSKTIAVAVNEKVIQKSDWHKNKIISNDKVDIVRAVGGG